MALRTLEEKLGAIAERTQRELHDMHPEWSGIAFDAAADRADRERAETLGIQHAIDDMADAVARHSETLIFAAEHAKNVAAAAEEAGLAVADDWTLTARFTVDEESAARRQEDLAYFGPTLDAADTELARSLTDVIGTLERNAVEGEGLSGTQGQQLGEAIANGDLSPAQLAAVSQALITANLSGEQLATLEAGGEVATVPQSTQDFTREFFRAAGKDGVLSLQSQLEAKGTPQANAALRAMGNSMLALSHERIGTGRDASGKLTSPGGYEKLPQDIKELVSSREKLPVSNNLDWNSSYLNGGTDYAGLSALANLLHGADPGYQPGAYLGTELIRQSAILSASETAASVGTPSMPSSISGLLEVGARNTDASAAILSGQGGPEILGGGYDPSKALTPLLEMAWVGESPAVNKLFDWIPEDAHSADPTVRERSQEAFGGLLNTLTETESSFGTNTFADLMNTGGESLGARNPAVVQAIGQAATPYLNDIAGQANSTTGHRLIAPISQGDALRFAALVSTDPTAATTWAGDIHLQQDSNAAAIGRQGPTDPRVSTWGLANGSLQRILQSGYIAERSSMEIFDDETAEHAEKSATQAVTITKDLSMFIPYAGPPVSLITDIGTYSADGAEPADGLLNGSLRDSHDATVTVTVTGSNMSQLYSLAAASELPLSRYPEELVEIDPQGNARLRPLADLTAPVAGFFPDEANLRSLLAANLKSSGYDVAGFEDARAQGEDADGTASGGVEKIETQDDYTRLATGKVD